MDKNARRIIFRLCIGLAGLYLVLQGIVRAKPFLVPFSFAILFSMILVPVDNKLRSWGFPKALSVITSDVLLLAFCLSVFFVAAKQIHSFSGNWPQYKEKLMPKVQKAEHFIEKQTGITAQRQEEAFHNIVVKETGTGSHGENSGAIARAYPEFISFSANFALFFIYIFFFMYYRHKFRNAVLNFFQEDKRERAAKILAHIGSVGRQYLVGRFILMLILWGMYTVGLLIIGLKHAMLVSLIAALLNLIPYFGNVIALFMILIVGLMTNGSPGTLVGILVVFSVDQFFESYFIEPYVVGHKVELNPAITLTGVVVGGYLWGIPGMILFIPLMGFLKTIFDGIPGLTPIGYIFDERDTRSGGEWIRKLKDSLFSGAKK